MRREVMVALAAGIILTAPGAAEAQRKGGSADTIPAAYRPPAGMCRVWITDVPPAKQAAPTDCPTAVRNVPPGAKVIFGDTASKGKAVPPGGRAGSSGTPPTKVIPPVRPPRSDTSSKVMARRTIRPG